MSAHEIDKLDAEALLKKGLQILMSDESLVDRSCVLAKIFAPDGMAVCLRADRDYYNIYVRDENGTATIDEWQFAFTFRGFSQDELWCNMVALLQKFKQEEAAAQDSGQQ